MTSRAAGEGGATGSPARSAIWPVALAIVIRLGVWLALPASRFASDEDSYVQVAKTLVGGGKQDLFWPPVTGWLIATVAWVLQTTALPVIRLAWIAMDIGCVLAVRALARRVASAAATDHAVAAERLTVLATVGYALYLPAVSFAQFATSEVPALLQTLLIIVLLTTTKPSWRSFLAAGLLTGTLVLTRPSLLPLLVFLPAATLFYERTSIRFRHAAMFVLAGTLVIGAYAIRNWRETGELTIARNSAYNLYIGNREMYAEDLDLFSPRATPGQIEFRRQHFGGTLTYPTQSPAELQREAIGWIVDHPGQFARRMAGRLARVFVPKTDVLELVGGEQHVGIFSPVSLTLLAVTNIQWAIVLFGGLIGLVALWRLDPALGAVFISVLLGSLPLCLVAISKPRYAFVFEPLLLLGAAALATGGRRLLRRLAPRHRWAIALMSIFILWGWSAWAIFSISSRLALANPA